MVLFFILLVAIVVSIPVSNWMFETLVRSVTKAAYSSAFDDIVKNYDGQKSH